MCAGICRRKNKQINCFFFSSFFFFFFLFGFIVGSFVIVAALKKERQKEAFDNLNRTQMASNYFSLLFFFLCVCVSFANVQRAGRVGLTFAKGKTRCSNDIYVRVGCMWACVFVRIKKKPNCLFLFFFFFFLLALCGCVRHSRPA